MATPDKYFRKDIQYYKFCLYGFLKNLRFFEPFLVLFFLEKDLTFLQIGILFAVREITRNLLEIPAGIFSDAFGRRKTMVFSFLLYIISFVVFTITSGFGYFVLAMIIYALGDAFRTGTHKAMIFDYLKLKGWEGVKIHYYGHTRSWSQIGSAISALIAAALVFATGNYKMIFLFSAIPYILDLILLLSYPKVLDGQLAGLEKNNVIASLKKISREFILALKNLKTLRILTNASIYSGYYKAVKDFLQPVIQSLALALPVLLILGDEQRTAIVIGIAYFVIFLMSSWASRMSGRFADIFQRIYKPLNYSLVFGLILGVLSGFFYHSGLYLISVICYLLIYMAENLRRPMGVSLISEVLPGNILASSLSAESQLKSLFAAILAPLLGWLADLYGIGTGLMAVSAVVLILLPFIWIGKKRKSSMERGA